jgi:hypothetical protein
MGIESREGEVIARQLVVRFADARLSAMHVGCYTRYSPASRYQSRVIFLIPRDWCRCCAVVCATCKLSRPRPVLLPASSLQWHHSRPARGSIPNLGLRWRIDQPKQTRSRRRVKQGGLLAQSTISMNRPDYHLETRIDSHLVPLLMAESTGRRKLELDQTAWRLMERGKAQKLEYD